MAFLAKPIALRHILEDRGKAVHVKAAVASITEDHLQADRRVFLTLIDLFLTSLTID